MNCRRLKTAMIAAGILLTTTIAAGCPKKIKIRFSSRPLINEPIDKTQNNETGEIGDKRISTPWKMKARWGIDGGHCEITPRGTTYLDETGQKIRWVSHLPADHPLQGITPPKAVYCSESKTIIVWNTRVDKIPGAVESREALVRNTTTLPHIAIGSIILKNGTQIMTVDREEVVFLSMSDRRFATYSLWKKGKKAPEGVTPKIGEHDGKIRIIWPGSKIIHYVRATEDGAAMIGEDAMKRASPSNVTITCTEKGCIIKNNETVERIPWSIEQNGLRKK